MTSGPPRRRLRGVAIRTPLVAFGAPDDRRYLKAESLQPIGAFKLRGAYVAVASLSPEALARGVITYSSGNHAQGVARAARLLGAPAVVVMPSDAPAVKRDRVAADGAEIVVVGTVQRRAAARSPRRSPRQRGLADHPAVRRRPDHRRPGDGRARDRRGRAGSWRVVLVPIGGGGLASGVATADQEPPARASASSVSNQSWPPTRASRSNAGEIVALAGRPRVADDRRRDADAGARRPDVRAPARAPRFDRDRLGGRDRRRRPPRRRTEPARRRAIGRAGRSPR